MCAAGQCKMFHVEFSEKNFLFDPSALGFIPLKWTVRISDGNSEHVAHVGRKIGLFGVKINPICDFSRSNQMP